MLQMHGVLLEQARRLRRQLESEKGGNFHWEIGEALNRLREATLGLLPEDERAKYEALLPSLQIRKNGPYTISPHEARLSCDQILSVLESMPGGKKKPAEFSPVTRVLPESSRVFVIHGHDTTNLLRLRSLLREKFRLTPVILSEEPSKGRSIIEKFESEAASCAFAFAILTPDDFVKSNSKEYTQARPNVVFELGWFYGRLGRDRVCILFQKGTAIPSDLNGIGRVEFGDSVDEKFIDIEAELEAAKLSGTVDS